MLAFGSQVLACSRARINSAQECTSEIVSGGSAWRDDECNFKSRLRQRTSLRWSAVRLTRESKRGSFATDQRGASAVEFAFVLPVLIILLTGVIQMGLTFFVQHNMVSVSQETARLVALGELTEAQGQTYALDHVIDWGMSYNVDVNQVGDDIVVDITVPMSDVSLIDYLGLFKTGNLSAQSSMRVL